MSLRQLQVEQVHLDLQAIARLTMTAEQWTCAGAHGLHFLRMRLDEDP